MILVAKSILHFVQVCTFRSDLDKISLLKAEYLFWLGQTFSTDQAKIQVCNQIHKEPYFL